MIRPPALVPAFAAWLLAWCSPVRADFVEPMPEPVTKVYPVYTDSARAAGLEGLVVVQVLVGKDGGVKQARVVRSVPGLDGAAYAAASRWIFVPAKANGQPVSVWVAIPFRFGPAQGDAADSAVAAIGAREPEVRFEPPSAVLELPLALRRALEARRCWIPEAPRGCNVFRAQLERWGQWDWVAYCCTDTTCRVLVFLEGSPERVEEVGRGAVPRAIPEGGDPCSYWRAKPDDVRALARAWGDTSATPWSRSFGAHDAIEERRGSCCSELLYRDEGRWIRLGSSANNRKRGNRR